MAARRSIFLSSSSLFIFPGGPLASTVQDDAKGCRLVGVASSMRQALESLRQCDTRGQARVASVLLQSTNCFVRSTAKRSHEGRPREKSKFIRGRAWRSAFQGVMVDAVCEGETHGNGGKVKSPNFCWPCEFSVSGVVLV